MRMQAILLPAHAGKYPSDSPWLNDRLSRTMLTLIATWSSLLDCCSSPISLADPTANSLVYLLHFPEMLGRVSLGI